MKKIQIRFILFIMSVLLVSSFSAVSADPVNLFVNPSFEDFESGQLPAGWSFWGNCKNYFPDTESFTDGKKGLRFEIPDDSQVSAVWQRVKVQPGKSYEFRMSSRSIPALVVNVEMKAYTAENQQISVDWDWVDGAFRIDQIKFYNWDGKGDFLMMKAITNQKNFGESWFQFTVPEDSGCAELEFYVCGWYRTGTAWVDNVRLIEL